MAVQPLGTLTRRRARRGRREPLALQSFICIYIYIYVYIYILVLIIIIIIIIIHIHIIICIICIIVIMFWYPSKTTVAQIGCLRADVGCFLHFASIMTGLLHQ